jgi:hypothetical protein
MRGSNRRATQSRAKSRPYCLLGERGKRRVEKDQLTALTQEKRASDRSRNAQESTNESFDDVGLDVFVVLEDEDLGVVRSKPFGQAVGAGDVAERAVGLEKVEEFLHKRYE